MSLIKHSGVLSVLPVLSLLIACSENSIPAEDEIKQYITMAQRAAEERDHNDLADLIQGNYHDQQNFDKKRIKQMLRGYFFMHKNIHLFTQIKSIHFLDDKSAFVTVYVAMSGTAIANINALSKLRARIYKFELQLVKNNEWLLQQAKWQPANISDIL